MVKLAHSCVRYKPPVSAHGRCSNSSLNFQIQSTSTLLLGNIGWEACPTLGKFNRHHHLLFQSSAQLNLSHSPQILSAPSLQLSSHPNSTPGHFPCNFQFKTNNTNSVHPNSVLLGPSYSILFPFSSGTKFNSFNSFQLSSCQNFVF